MTMPSENRSALDLLSDLMRDIPELFRKEVRLLKVELSEKMSQLQVGIGSLLAGAILLLAALLVLLQALVIALANAGLGPGWSAALVGAVVAIIGVILLKKGSDDVSAASLTPERTVHQVKKDAELAREQVS